MTTKYSITLCDRARVEVSADKMETNPLGDLVFSGVVNSYNGPVAVPRLVYARGYWLEWHECDGEGVSISQAG